MKTNYIVYYTIYNPDGTYSTKQKKIPTIVALASTCNSILDAGGEIVKIECWSIRELSKEERQALNLLTHSRVKLS